MEVLLLHSLDFTCLSSYIILVIWEGELLEVRIEHIRSQVVYGCLGSKGSKAPRWYQFGIVSFLKLTRNNEVSQTQTFLKLLSNYSNYSNYSSHMLFLLLASCFSED